MGLLETLGDPTLRSIYAPGVVAGVGVALLCGVASPLVVVRRMGFIGQGISHSAFGGIGVAAMLAAWGWVPAGGLGEFAVILGFCALAAVGMVNGGAAGRGGGSSLSGASRGGGGRGSWSGSEDTAIGVYLVGSMALGAVLVQAARDHALGAGRPADVRSWESILFGSVLLAGWREVALAWGTLAAAVVAMWWVRRPMLAWAVDEEGARALGVPTGLVRAALGVVLAGVVVASMKVAGVVLASALLILPGATALRVSDRLWVVVGLSCAAAFLAVVAGIGVAMEFGWPPGPSIVGVMIAGLAGASMAGRRG